MYQISFELPVPPSENRYRRWLNGRPTISADGRRYRRQVSELCHGATPFTGRIAVRVELYPPDRRRRDLDNILKALLDSLTHAGVWLDDAQIDRLSVVRKQCVPGGCVVVEVREEVQ